MKCKKDKDNIIKELKMQSILEKDKMQYLKRQNDRFKRMKKMPDAERQKEALSNLIEIGVIDKKGNFMPPYK